MELIDTHTHLYCEEFDQDREEVIQRACEAGVTTMLLPAIDNESYERQEMMAQNHPELFHQMMGLHPTSVDERFREKLTTCKKRLFGNPEKYIAIGEIGLDFYWDRTFEKEQEEVLHEQFRWAIELNKPVDLHVRNSYGRMLEILEEKEFRLIRGVFHCFSGTLEQAMIAIEKGFYIGIGGAATFKKSNLPEIIANIPLDKIVIETDSPYLAPMPHRGKRNESAFVINVAKKIAEIKEVSFEQVAEQTTFNAKKIFCL